MDIQHQRQAQQRHLVFVHLNRSPPMLRSA
jgi:hypothetical protein